MQANDQILAQCSQYVNGFTAGGDFGFTFFCGLFGFMVLFCFMQNVLNKAPYLPFAPTLYELERRKQFLEILIARKKKQLEKSAVQS